jgi:integrase
MAQIKKLADGKYLIRASKGTGPTRNYVNKTFRGTRKKAREARPRARDADRLRACNQSLFRFEEYFEALAACGHADRRPANVSRATPITSTATPSRRFATCGSRTFAACTSRRSTPAFRISARRPIRNLNAALRACFGYAVRKEYLSANPCKYVDLPKKKRTREIVVLDLDEAPAFTHLCRQMPNGLLFEFYLETGLRPAEGLGIRWSDVTLKAGAAEIFVQQSVQFTRSGGGGYYFKDIKTKKGRRRIPLSETCGSPSSIIGESRTSTASR